MEPPEDAKVYAEKCDRYNDAPGKVLDVVNLARAYLKLLTEQDELREAVNLVISEAAIVRRAIEENEVLFRAPRLWSAIDALAPPVEAATDEGER
jgi:hypothetical protein